MKNLLIIIIVFFTCGCIGCKKDQTIEPIQEVPALKYNIMCLGNSIVEGWPLMDGGYVKCIAEDLNVPAYNLGIGGITTAQMISNSIGIDTMPITDSTTVLIVDEAINDLRMNGSGHTSYQNYKTYCSQRKALNPKFKIVLVVPTPQSYNGPSVVFEEQRQLLRNLLIADFQKTSDSIVYNKGTYADVLVDLAADSIMGYSGCEVNPLYYVDRIHLTHLGNVQRASLIEKGIKEVLK